MEPTGRSGLAPTPIAELFGITCPQLRAQAVRTAVDALGFRWLDVIHVAPGRAPRPVLAWAALAPPGEPCGSAVEPLDPRLALALGTSMPQAWDVDALEASARGKPAPEQRSLLAWRARLCEARIRCGLSFAARADSGSAWVVSLYAQRTAGRWLGDGVVGQALLLGCVIAQWSADQAVHACPAIYLGEVLSDTQREILECLSQGMGDKVIADRLGMTTYNVDYHLRRLRQRFGARNRVQLVQVLRSQV